MTFVDSGSAAAAGDDLDATLDGLQLKTGNLGLSAKNFATIMAQAFTQAASGGKRFDDVLKSLALRLSKLAVMQAFKPLAGGLSTVLNDVFGAPAVKPFATGGVIGAPSYFPLAGGGLGLAGEAGPEAIVPLARGADGRLGVAMAGPSAGANVTVQVATPDLASFRRSEAYLTGQIARAVARGQRNL
jgi:phage-related minor tail protein